MGCGCGGRKNLRSIRSSTTPTAPQAGDSTRRVQVQSVQRQVLVQQAKDRMVQRGAVGADTEAERKRRIQVSLRSRNSKNQGNQ